MINKLNVLFDMDGLMLDTEALSCQAWRNAATELGTCMDDDLLHRMTGLNHAACLQLLAQHPASRDYMPALAEKARQAYRQLLQNGNIPLKTGIIPLLQFLQAEGIARAVGTATERQLAELKLGRSGLAPYFSHIVTANDVQHSKPAPDTYLQAAALLGASPQDCIVLEDSPPGAQAALAAGMRVIIIPDLVWPDTHTAKQALAICQSLHEAHALLRGLIVR